MRRILSIAFCIVLVWFTISCTDDRVYRSSYKPLTDEKGNRHPNEEGGADCRGEIPREDTILPEDEINREDALCFFQTHAVVPRRVVNHQESHIQLARHHIPPDMFVRAVLCKQAVRELGWCNRTSVPGVSHTCAAAMGS